MEEMKTRLPSVHPVIFVIIQPVKILVCLQRRAYFVPSFLPARFVCSVNL